MKVKIRSNAFDFIWRKFRHARVRGVEISLYYVWVSTATCHPTRPVMLITFGPSWTVKTCHQEFISRPINDKKDRVSNFSNECSLICTSTAFLKSWCLEDILTQTQVKINTSWTYLSTGCVPLNDKISDGKVLRNDSSDGRMIYRFHCNVGFCLTGSTVISCFHGKWNGTKPSCQLISKFKCIL